MFPVIGEESYLRSYFSEGHRHQSFNCAFAVNFHCNPWESDTIKALGLCDFKPKPIFRRDTSFSSTAAKRYSRGVLLSIKGRDQEKKKPNKTALRKVLLGHRRMHPEGHPHFPACFCLTADFEWLLEAGARKGRFQWILKSSKWEWAGMTGIPESPARTVDLKRKGKQSSSRLRQCCAAPED